MLINRWSSIEINMTYNSTTYDHFDHLIEQAGMQLTCQVFIFRYNLKDILCLIDVPHLYAELIDETKYFLILTARLSNKIERFF